LILKLASVDPNDILVKAQLQGLKTSSADLAHILTADAGVDPSTVHKIFPIQTPHRLLKSLFHQQMTHFQF
jgi:hypothetical protein